MTVGTHATRGITSHEDTSHPHRSRLNSTKKPQTLSGIGGHHNNHHKSRRRSLQHEDAFIPDLCDSPAYTSCVESGYVQRNNPLYDASNNNQTNILDLNHVKSYNRGIPISAYPKSLIQWPVDGSTKNKRISEVKKQVKLLGNFIKMTVGGGHHAEALSDDKTPTNPPPFSGHVDMSRIPVHNLAHSADETSMAKWDDIKTQMQTGRMKEAKQMVRETDWSLGSPARENLWREMCRHHSSEKDFGDFYYWDSVKQIYGTTELSECSVQMPAFIDTSYKISHSLSPRGVTACERIISVIAFSHPAITYAPSLYALTSMLLHYMDEVDAYNCMAALVSGAQNKFLTQTKIANEAHWRAAMILGKKHIRGAFSTLSKFGVPQEQIEEAFHSWIWWILAALPITHVVRVLDCFLFEGSKVMLRIALAIFHLFVKAVAHDPAMVGALPSKGLNESIMQFCQNIQISPQKLLKTAFGIRAFSKSEITKVVVQTEMYLKSQRMMGGGSSGIGQPNVPETPALNRSVSLEGLPTSESQSNIQMMSHTLTIKEGSRSPAPRVRAMGQYPIQSVKSMVVTRDELLTLWSWLPMRMTMHQPTLVYTTEEHGCSLTTFFQRVEKHEPTLLCIRTLDDYVFGAYCSTAWAQRHHKDEFGNWQTYFGTGETFLFTLRPTVAKYQWIGISKQQDNAELSSVEHSQELFMHADSNMITIGGGNGQGIMLDHDFRYGKTETCQTFENPPLVPNGDFEVKIIEVYSLVNM
ncbi:GTPase-activating protein skywalker-like isoform X2 [Homarus americanus]|uniref:GTPase-activating protein skywalker-like isoform X2 n=1 Tax=Homarus americanus TaxID=6706 RepID=UPI001C465FFF|nr:GTPase-activating protein skywalker-like isoform X2 [Homarus americanus]